MGAKPLNLDELYGAQAEPVEVIWGGVTYGLKPLGMLTPEEMLTFMQFQAAGEGDVAQAVTAADAVLRVLCADLPLDEMPFMAKAAALSYYSEAQGLTGEGDAEKKG